MVAAVEAGVVLTKPGDLVLMLVEQFRRIKQPVHHCAPAARSCRQTLDHLVVTIAPACRFVFALIHLRHKQPLYTCKRTECPHVMIRSGVGISDEDVGNWGFLCLPLTVRELACWATNVASNAATIRRPARSALAGCSNGSSGSNAKQAVTPCSRK